VLETVRTISYHLSGALIALYLSLQRFSQALLNNELAEISNKSLSSELQDLRVSFDSLSTEHARSAGWEARLRQAMQERDDLRQERDTGAQKLRAAETKLASLGNKCGESHRFNRFSATLLNLTKPS
jgi:hypothetical protein